MRMLLLFLLPVTLGYELQAQSPSSAADRDSLQKVMEVRMKRWRAQREMYERLYQQNPKYAVDSSNAARKQANLASGQQRLIAYKANTRIDTLREIDLSYAGLTEVPDFVLEAIQMKILVLDWNDIRKIPKALANLDSLKRIYWKANNLDQYWWIRIPNIGGLVKLDLSNNSLTRVPRGIRKLAALREVVLDENFLGKVPVKRLSKVPSIREVSLNKSHQITLGEADYGKLGFLETLKVNHSGITQIHPSFYQLKGLKELQLQENELTALPDGISALASLEKLSFYKNHLKTLPADLFDLDLTIIDLYYNDLEVIPEEIGNFSDLEVLFLAHNRIYSLPESIGNLNKLDELYVHHNRLSVLPESLSTLRQLRVARVNDNYLSEFPVQFTGMKGLEDLDVSNNQLKSLSPEVEKLPALELFNYQENPIDFNASINQYISPMIVRMLEHGVTCVPRIYQEEVSSQ